MFILSSFAFCETKEKPVAELSIKEKMKLVEKLRAIEAENKKEQNEIELRLAKRRNGELTKEEEKQLKADVSALAKKLKKQSEHFK
jgi:hypothetical protein